MLHRILNSYTFVKNALKASIFMKQYYLLIYLKTKIYLNTTLQAETCRNQEMKYFLKKKEIKYGCDLKFVYVVDQFVSYA